MKKKFIREFYVEGFVIVDDSEAEVREVYAGDIGSVYDFSNKQYQPKSGNGQTIREVDNKLALFMYDYNLFEICIYDESYQYISDYANLEDKDIDYILNMSYDDINNIFKYVSNVDTNCDLYRALNTIINSIEKIKSDGREIVDLKFELRKVEDNDF